MACSCGHRLPTRPTGPHGESKVPLTYAALMETPRLVDLITRRPDLADLPLIGARIGCGIGENC